MTDTDVDHLMRFAIESFGRDVDEMAERMADHLFEHIPELGDDLDARHAWTVSNRENARSWLGLMASGADAAAMTPPPAATRVAEAYVLNGAELPALLRVYRVGHAFAFDEWTQVLRSAGAPSEVFDEVLRMSLQTSFAYVDAMSAHIAETYAQARADAFRSADIARAEMVRRLVGGAPVEPDAASAVLGYDLRRWHIGVVAWGDGTTTTSVLRDAVDEVVSAVGTSSPLVIAQGGDAVWAWTAAYGPVHDERMAAAAALRWEHGVSISIGGPADGVAGFVEAHADAAEARRVAALARRGTGRVVLHRDLQLLGLLTKDPSAARRFCIDRLGAMAAADPTTRRLRTTLYAYLDEGRSHAAASRRLGVHENTIKYRIRRCEELLGRPVASEGTELVVALLLLNALET